MEFKDFKKYEIIDTLEELERITAIVEPIKEFTYDVETTSLRYAISELTAISIYSPKYRNSVSILFNFKSRYTVKERDPVNKRRKIDIEKIYERKNAIEIKEALPYLLRIFKDKQVTGHNIKFDLKLAIKYGYANFNIEDDTMVMAYYLNTSARKGLKELSGTILGIRMQSYADTIKQKVTNIDWTKVDFYEYGKYSAFDSYVTHKLKEALQEKMENFKELHNIDIIGSYRETGLKIIPVVAKMEIAGVKVDLSILEKMGKRMTKRIKELEGIIHEKADVEFLISSSKQMIEVLFDRLGLPVTGKTDKGAVSVNEASLKKLNFLGHDIVTFILEYRKLTKLYSTYIQGIPALTDPDGRIRSSFNETGTQSGRFSSSQPNLQNISVRNKEFMIRTAYTHSKKKLLVGADFSQIEMRLYAHFSQDKYLLEAYREEKDIHQYTADLLSKDTKLTRSEGKTINFAIGYLMGANSLAETLNEKLREEVIKGKLGKDKYKKLKITKKVAQKLIDDYFHTFSGFRKLGDAVTKKAKKKGFARTIGNMIRYIPELREKNYLYYSGKRYAINHYIQGSAAELIKQVMIQMDELIKEKYPNTDLLLQIHDELIYDVPEKLAKEFKKDLQRIGENIYPQCTVPIRFDAGIFKNWMDVKLEKEYKQNNDYLYLI